MYRIQSSNAYNDSVFAEIHYYETFSLPSKYDIVYVQCVHATSYYSKKKGKHKTAKKNRQLLQTITKANAFINWVSIALEPFQLFSIPHHTTIHNALTIQIKFIVWSTIGIFYFLCVSLFFHVQQFYSHSWLNGALCFG